MESYSFQCEIPFGTDFTSVWGARARVLITTTRMTFRPTLMACSGVRGSGPKSQCQKYGCGWRLTQNGLRAASAVVREGGQPPVTRLWWPLWSRWILIPGGRGRAPMLEPRCQDALHTSLQLQTNSPSALKCCTEERNLAFLVYGITHLH